MLNDHPERTSKIVTQIIWPTLQAGGDIGDIMVLLEDIVAATLCMTLKVGHDRAMDLINEHVREMMPEMIAQRGQIQRPH